MTRIFWIILLTMTVGSLTACGAWKYLTIQDVFPATRGVETDQHDIFMEFDDIAFRG